MPPIPQDRLIRKEVALGLIREFEPPQNHIGTRLLAPWQSVQSDDVIFDYTTGLSAGLAPARAEDAESELAQKDETTGYGRAAIIDWALKDHYDPSDVTRYREGLIIGGITGASSLPLTTSSMVEGFQAKLARDARIRRRKLDNRIEWLITQALGTGQIVYNDGKIKFTVNYGRPSNQVVNADVWWDNTNADPIGEILAVQEFMEELYGVTMDRAIVSQKIVNRLMTSERFTNMLIGSNPLYTVQGWGVDAARQRVQSATGLNFITYDSVYRVRPLGTTSWVNTRFLDDRVVYFLPSEADLDALDDTVGFGATLTSPHPEGNWQSGFYEWEQGTKDPWGHDVGTGVKAFPVFPHLDLTFNLKVLA